MASYYSHLTATLIWYTTSIVSLPGIRITSKICLLTATLADKDNPMHGYQIIRQIPYSLKFLGTKIFVDFVVFEAPTKILSTKFSAYITCKTCNVC